MGENYKALVWRAGQVDMNGDMLTADALKQMAAQMRPGSDIFLSFDFRLAIGHVSQAWVEDDALYMHATFDDPVFTEALSSGQMSIRPGFSIEAKHAEYGHRMVDEVGTTHLALTPNPMPLPGDQV